MLVEFGIDLGDCGGAVAEDNPCGFQPKLLTQERGGVVAELVRMPVVLLMPCLQFVLLLFGQAILPLCLALAGLLSQRFGGGAVACEKSLRELIEQRGMAGFCRVEQEYIACLDIKNAVIATGGSAVYYESAMNALKAGGLIVYLHLPLADLQSRLGDLNARGVVLEPDQDLKNLYAKRIPLHQRWADITVPLACLNHDQAVDAVITALNNIDSTGI